MVYAFDEYSLDPERRELRYQGKVAKTEPQVFDVLEYLIRNRQRIVSKSDLIAAVWDGRIVSESTVSSRISAARRSIGDTGKVERFIKTISGRGFRFVGSVEEPQPISDPIRRISDSIPLAPSVVILPFAHSGDPQEEAASHGIVEDVTTALSQNRWLSILARSSACSYRGWSIDIRQAGRELLVQYIVEGSVRKRAGVTRVTSRLVSATSGVCIWARHFDLENGDLRSQDEIVSRIVAAVGSELEQVEVSRMRREPPDQLNHVQQYLRGVGYLLQWDKEGIEFALRTFRDVIAVRPDFWPAHGMAAYCYVQRKSYGWIGDRSIELQECEQLSRTAAEGACDDCFTLSKAAHAIASVVGDLDTGANIIERALKLNPHLAAAWYVSGWIRLFLGKPKLAMEELGRAITINPCDPLVFKMRAGLAYAYLMDGRYDEATKQAFRAMSARPGYLTAIRGAAASQALAGNRDDARRLIRLMRERDSSLRAADLPQLIPFKRQQDVARWADGLIKAGLSY